MDNNTYKRLDFINKQLLDYIAKKLLEPEHSGICSYCKKNKDTIKMRRQNTLFEKQDENYTESCKECFEEKEEYWNGMWKDYYSSLL